MPIICCFFEVADSDLIHKVEGRNWISEGWNLSFRYIQMEFETWNRLNMNDRVKKEVNEGPHPTIEGVVTNMVALDCEKRDQFRSSSGNQVHDKSWRHIEHLKVYTIGCLNVWMTHSDLSPFVIWANRNGPKLLPYGRGLYEYNGKFYAHAKVTIAGIGIRMVKTPATSDIVEMAGHCNYMRRLGQVPALSVLQGIPEVPCLPHFFHNAPVAIPNLGKADEPTIRCIGCNRSAEVTPYNSCGCSFCVNCSQKIRWKIIEEKLAEDFCPACMSEFHWFRETAWAPMHIL